MDTRFTLSKNLLETEVRVNLLEPNFVLEEWGLVDYEEALARQEKYVAEIAKGERPETLVLCTHPAVVTVGRGTQAGDITTWQGRIVEVSRGGRATYHGPDQLVAYPLLNLGQRGHDLKKYLRWLEQVVVDVLSRFGVEGTTLEGATGVWVGERKICSLGIAVRQWVSFHGLSLAVDQNPSAYQGINPCGYSPQTMVSLEELVSGKFDRRQVESTLVQVFTDRLKALV